MFVQPLALAGWARGGDAEWGRGGGGCHGTYDSVPCRGVCVQAGGYMWWCFGCVVCFWVVVGFGMCVQDGCIVLSHICCTHPRRSCRTALIQCTQDDDAAAAWPVVVRDASSVMTCLKRALKMANAAQQQSAIRGNPSTEAVSLYVEILNHYLYFFDQGLESITPSVIQVRGRRVGCR